MSLPVKHLSDAIAEPLTTAYRAGGFGLAFLLLGALMMLTALFIPRGILAFILVFLGFTLVMVPCYFFYIKEIRPLAMAQQATLRNKDMVDTIQATAISLTELALEIQALAFKHADQVATAFDIARPQVRAIPIVGRVADHPAIASADALAKQIVDLTSDIEEVVNDVKHALIASDPKGLTKYLHELQELKGKIARLLAGSPFGRQP